MVLLANSTYQLEIFLDLGLTFGTNLILISEVIVLIALLNTMRSNYNLGYHPVRHWNTEPSITSPLPPCLFHFPQHLSCSLERQTRDGHPHPSVLAFRIASTSSTWLFGNRLSREPAATLVGFLILIMPSGTAN